MTARLPFRAQTVPDAQTVQTSEPVEPLASSQTACMDAGGGVGWGGSGLPCPGTRQHVEG